MSAPALPDFALLVERMAESVLVTTTDLDRPGPTIVYANPRFERMTGWTLAEVRGRSPRLLQGPATDPASYAGLRRVARGEPWEGRVVNYRQDGTPFVMEWSVVALPDADGVVRHYAAVQRDVTRRVGLEREAASAARARVDLLAMMGHELRTPLTAVLGFAGLLLEDAGPASPAAGHARGVLAGGRELLARVEAILGYVEGSVAAAPLDEAEVDLGGLVGARLDALAPAAAARGLAASLRRGGPAVRVRADARVLGYAVGALLANAVGFGRPGGRVEVGLARGPSSAGVLVRDDGPGIAPEALPGLGREPFRRAAAAGGPGGVGLGLALARRAAEMHGGTLRLRSAPGRGTTAVLRLPAARLVVGPRGDA